jgi:anthranilate phosphoribosyltransferase
MARGTNKFRQREITRSIKAAKAAGEKVDRVEIETDGKIVVHLGTGGDSPKKINSADAVLEKLKHEQKS